VLPGDRRHIAAVRLLRRRIDHAIANSDAGAEVLRARIGVDRDRISVISNGVPAERVAVRRSREAVRGTLGIDPAVPIICSVGRVDYQRAKDYATLMAAARVVVKQVPELQVLVVGPTKSELERELGVQLPPHVHVVGWQAQPTEWMNAADVVVVHSRTEGHSNVADEALMLGLPVATTDTGSHPPLVRQCGGRVAPVGRGDLLGSAIVDLLADPPSRDTVSQIARDALSITNVASALLDRYARLAGVNQPPRQRYGSARAPA
jgi:glycosyltransferase involved in cell wall biosynthesis